MSTFDRYKDAYANAKLTRTPGGVLEVRFHTDGAKLVFNGHTHEQFTDMFHQIGEDPENRVVILTGSGDAFMDAISPEGFDFFTPRGYDKIFREGRKILMNILDIEVPMIAALNGPVLLHSEYVLLCDIVVATPGTVFQDMPHAAFGIAPNDGVHLLWPEMIGSIRGRYFVLTQQKLDAEEAKSLGVVNEIVPANQLLERAHAIAATIAKQPPLTTKYTRIGLTQRLRRVIDEGIGYGLALEGITAAEVARTAAAQNAA
ncbi:enoyl-CoA hydratase/isomerase family protein [Paraburkholderia sp. SARCC-3016]|jgi:enoyl-CoA hydratase/carnithine racemase|uniref:enoyl-CoA hydratase/isomerase family protein n=1 Tax=Paraburkholderia sp. SARCC-3016 TaxID=3058611 RepID=UPI002809C096|nr:enoyl-CoA hydratase/isomerase family protein [Paraburkholderia sp. SARCC-3016]MDQ7976076.1 enoyl-CoA hydratase/isomerase family protein [Paraburkholderia sp. SARCC-3016]